MANPIGARCGHKPERSFTALMPFWWRQGGDFRAVKSAALFRFLGSLSMACAASLPLVHDAAINLTVFFMAPALLMLALRLSSTDRLALSLLMLSGLISFANFLMWQLEIYVIAIPVVQKLAVFACLGFIVLCNERASIGDSV